MFLFERKAPLGNRASGELSDSDSHGGLSSTLLNEWHILGSLQILPTSQPLLPPRLEPLGRKVPHAQNPYPDGKDRRFWDTLLC